MKTMQATLAAAVWGAAAVAAMRCPAPASADPPIGRCDPGALTVAAGSSSSGLGHRAVQLDFTVQPGAGACQMSGYPTVDAFVETEPNVEGAAPIHAEQTPTGYLGAPVPGGTVTLDPGHGAHAMLEWVAFTTARDPRCQIYGDMPTDITLRVTPPGMSQAFSIPISVGRNEGLCGLEVHPLTGDST
jgi:hypothetical protein